MTDETGAVEAAAEPVAAPETATETTFEPTARGSIDRAFASLDAQDQGADQSVDQTEQPSGERPRNPDGTFKAKEATNEANGEQTDGEPAEEPSDTETAADKPLTSFAEAPNRFSADAKAAWKDAPEPVRAEITRAVKELEQGIEQYRAEAEPLKEYQALAKQHGTSIKAVLDQYTGLERSLKSGDNGQKMEALKSVFEFAGVPVHDFAAAIMGVQPDQAQQQNERTISQLRQELASLKQEIGGVTNTIRSRDEQTAMQQIEQFAADKPRFEELSNDIAFFLNNGRAKDLQEAYQLAERLNPGPQASQPAAPAAPDRTAQTQAGRKSVTGAPSSGSNPANRKTPSSAREAVDNAFASLGL